MFVLKKGFNLSKLYGNNIISMKILNDRYHFILKEIKFSTTCNRNTDKNKIRDEFWDEEKKKFENTFGGIEGFERKFANIRDDPDDIIEYERARSAQGKTLLQYTDEILSHLNNHRYKEALHVLEVDMVNDKIKGFSHIYGTFISYNAKLGNLEEAYRLYIANKKRQGFVTSGMYTSMFNACANCSNSFLALEKVETVREQFRNDKVNKMNTSHYNALIKAYGRHGDLASAFKVCDEILERRDRISPSTYCFLFQSCISDKNSGLRHALLLWRKMLQIGVKPKITHFNLMLRCVQDCSLGDILLIQDFYKKMQNEIQQPIKLKFIKKTNASEEGMILETPNKDSPSVLLFNKKEDKSLENFEEKTENMNKCTSKSAGDPVDKLDENQSSSNILPSSQISNCDRVVVLNEREEKAVLELEDSPQTDNFPNFLDLKPVFGSAISSINMAKPHNRFMCVGGTKGFLKAMSVFNVRPDIKTFTQMLNVIPKTVEAEKEIIAEAQAHNVKLDVTFFNTLIRNRCMREENLSIQEVLKIMQQEEVSPDILTFGTLAIGCSTPESALELIQSIHAFSFRTNKEILSTLLTKALKAKDISYIKLLLQVAKEDEVQIDPRLVNPIKKLIHKELLNISERREMMENAE